MFNVKNIFVFGDCEKSVADCLLQRKNEIPNLNTEFKVFLTENASALENKSKEINFMLGINGKNSNEIVSEIIKNAILFAKNLNLFSSQIVELPPEIICPTQTIRDFCYEIVEGYRNEICKTNKTPEIVVSIKDKTVYVLDGHHRLVATCREKKPFIRCRIESNSCFISELTPSDYFDYEDLADVSLPLPKQALSISA